MRREQPGGQSYKKKANNGLVFLLISLSFFFLNILCGKLTWMVPDFLLGDLN